MPHQFKRAILHAVFNEYVRFFLHAMPHPDLSIGKRGLVGEETTKGIVLVFSDQSYRDFIWEQDRILVSMRFAGVWEDIIIPYESIATIFDDAAMPEFIVNFREKMSADAGKKHRAQPQQPKKPEPEPDGDDDDDDPSPGKVVPFKKKS